MTAEQAEMRIIDVVATVTQLEQPDEQSEDNFELIVTVFDQIDNLIDEDAFDATPNVSIHVLDDHQTFFSLLLVHCKHCKRCEHDIYLAPRVNTRTSIKVCPHHIRESARLTILTPSKAWFSHLKASPLTWLLRRTSQT